ncbi:MAG: class I SAM-dependent RNA methyltransferase [Puniceicoccales bacterium]|jgi:23S rRNA (uracil1939-C5)-methyltransferase/tRNA (uracil-5-)-methyltransferase|nr:class I SAM-dependent RNA methyltransferase [Puniceicoccales bacterium]
MLSFMEKRVPKHFVPIPFSYHQVIELSIDNVTNLGIGIGRIDTWVVMVPFVLTGERVRARIYKNHKNYSEADLLEILESSPHRREAKCPLYGLCGGCQYQHIVYEEQLRMKQSHIREFFHRSGWTDAAVAPPLSGPEWHYRDKLTPHFQKPTFSQFPIGFLKRGNRNTLVDVPHCPIATEAINAALTHARSEIYKQWSSYRHGQTLLFRDVEGKVYQDPNHIVEQDIGKYRFFFRAGSFFQNNTQVLSKMLPYVISQAAEDATDFLIDAYCGVGLFAISAASHFKKIAGIEIDEDAVALARKNAARNAIDHVQFFHGTAEAVFEQITFPADQSVVIIDPPRKGCESSFLQQLMHFHPKKIIYISCDPSTQIRDLREMYDQGYYLRSIQPVDLFPQTRHMENIVTLSRD